MKRLHVHLSVEKHDQPVRFYAALFAAPQAACCPSGPEGVT